MRPADPPGYCPVFANVLTGDVTGGSGLLKHSIDQLIHTIPAVQKYYVRLKLS